MIGDVEEQIEGALTGVRTWWVLVPTTDDPAHGPEPILRSSVTHYVYPGPVVRNDEPPAPYDRFGTGNGTGRQPADEYGFFLFRPDRDVVVRELTNWMNAMESSVGHEVRNSDGKIMPKAFGLADAFGEVVVHENGYRAQKLRIRRLWIQKNGRDDLDWDWFVEGLADRYRLADDQIDLWPHRSPRDPIRAACDEMTRDGAEADRS